MCLRKQDREHKLRFLTLCEVWRGSASLSFWILYQADIKLVIVAAGTFLSLLAVAFCMKMTSSCRFLLHRLGVLCYRSLNSHLSCSARLCARIQPCTAQFRLLSCSHSLFMVHPQSTGICHYMLPHINMCFRFTTAVTTLAQSVHLVINVYLLWIQREIILKCHS